MIFITGKQRYIFDVYLQILSIIKENSSDNLTTNEEKISELRKLEVPQEFIEKNNNKIIFDSWIYYKYNSSFKNNKLNYIDYMCKIHRKDETKNKDKKLCYGKIRLNISNDDEKFNFITLHSEYCKNLNKTNRNQSLLKLLEDSIGNINEFN